MKLSHYDFDFNPDLIAKYPEINRDEARLMVVHRDTGEIEHKLFKDIIEYFGKGDNNGIKETVRLKLVTSIIILIISVLVEQIT